MELETLDLAKAWQLHDAGKLHGFYRMSEDDYRAAPGLNQSQLKIMKRCPALCKSGERRIRSRALDIGTLTHLLLLEGKDKFDEIACPMPDGNPRTKVFREKKKELLAEGKLLLGAEELESIFGIWKQSVKDPMVVAALKGGLKEVAVFAYHPEFGCLMKGKIDHLDFENAEITDLKTTSDADIRAFNRSAKIYGYDFQGAYYLDLVNLAIGKEHFKTFKILAACKIPPYLFNYFKIAPSDIALARRVYEDCLKEYIECEKNNHWPGYDQEWKTLNFGGYR